MLEKALLAGFITAFTLLFATNLAVHQGEADFILGWAYAKMENYPRAISFYRYGLSDAGKGTPLADKTRVALGAALTASWEYFQAVGRLSDETKEMEGESGARLEALRLYNLWNARAKGALSMSGETRRLELTSALVAYTGAYRLAGDPDAAFNHDVVAKLLEREKPPQKPEEKKEEEKKPEEPQKPEEKKDEEGKKQEEKKDETDQKDAGKNPDERDQPEKPAEEKNPEAEKKEKAEGKDETNTEPPKTGNWTNAGNTQSLQGDPGWSRGSNGSVPLSNEERKELENYLKNLSDLQKRGGQYLRPDGQMENPGAIPNGLRDLFSGDPFFQNMIPDAETGPNGKSW